jgi:hypothetical protein
MSEYEALLTDDQDSLRRLWSSPKIVEDCGAGQLALWPVDDLLGDKRYVRCPRRGRHARLTDCWMCWCDVAWGRATAAQLLESGGAGEAR